VSENYVQVPEDGAGKKFRTVQRTVGGNQVHDEVVEIARSSDGVAINPAEKTQLPSSLTASGNLKMAVSEDVVGLAKEAGGNLDSIKSKTDNLDVALSSRLKPADLNLDGEKDLQVDVKTLPNVTVGADSVGLAKEAGGNLAGIKTNTDKLDVNLSTRAAGSQLPSALTGNGNLKSSLEEVKSGVAVPVTDNSGSLTVDGSVSLGAALPSGNNNIGDMDIASLPAHLGTVEIRDPNTTSQKLAVDANGKIGVSSLPNVTIGAAIPAGNNNIGDVDVVTLPAVPAGDNVIGRTKITEGTNVVSITSGINPDSSKKALDVNIVQSKTHKMAKIDHAASGDNTIISAVAGKKIKVYAVVLVVSGAVNCKWKSGSNDISGDMNFNGKGEGYSQDINPPAFLLVNTNVNEALILNLSAAVAVDGYVCYWDDDAS
jgi:hypothetical protein